MFKAEIEAHNLKEKDTEPRHLGTLAPRTTLSELADVVRDSICQFGWVLVTGYSITIDVSSETKK